MKTITIQVKDLCTLNRINYHIAKFQPLKQVELDFLHNFLSNLPEAKALLKENEVYREGIKVELLDREEIQTELEKWMKLFESLPKNGSLNYPSICFVDGNRTSASALENIVIEVSFIPSITYANYENGFQTIDLQLKANGTAEFVLTTVDDTTTYPGLFNFNGSWKDAYLLTVKTIHEGWPQQKFPRELLKLLPK